MLKSLVIFGLLSYHSLTISNNLASFFSFFVAFCLTNPRTGRSQKKKKKNLEPNKEINVKKRNEKRTEIIEREKDHCTGEHDDGDVSEEERVCTLFVVID